MARKSSQSRHPRVGISRICSQRGGGVWLPRSGTHGALARAASAQPLSRPGPGGLSAHGRAVPGAFGTIGGPAERAFFTLMPNIRQQEKRVRTAGRERLENLRYRSTVKTLTRRLSAAVDGGDAEAVAAQHRELVRWIDRAVAHGALHRNTAARRKSQAARIVAGSRG